MTIGKERWVGFVYGPNRDLEAHKKVNIIGPKLISLSF